VINQRANVGFSVAAVPADRAKHGDAPGVTPASQRGLINPQQRARFVDGEPVFVRSVWRDVRRLLRRHASLPLSLWFSPEWLPCSITATLAGVNLSPFVSRETLSGRRFT